MTFQRFGDYLIAKGAITPKQFNDALSRQSRSRLLGQIAKNEKQLSEEEVLRILGFIKTHPHLRFGEIALALGYLTVGQMRHLLDASIGDQAQLGEILVREGALTQQALYQELAAFSSQRHRLRKVLICEPDVFIGRQLKLILAKHGYEIEIVKESAAAIESAHRRVPDILISGEGEDGTTGLELCRLISGDGGFARVNPVYLSTRLTPATLQEAFNAGVTHFLRKPLHHSEIINLLIEIDGSECKGRPEKILVVNQHPGARAAIMRELSGGWNRLFAADGAAAALESAEQNKPDIIILDADLPGMDGLHACRMLKERETTANIPVMLLAGGLTAAFRRQGFEAGAAEYCPKPFKPKQLANAVARTFDSAIKPKPEKILAVSDNPARLHILNYYLSKNGYSVVNAGGGHQAARLLPLCAPEMVVVDAGMKGMDGIEVTRHIKRSDLHHRIPVVVVCGTDDETERAAAAGANDCLAAPFDELALMAAVNVHLCGKSLIENLWRENIRLTDALNELEAERERLESLVASDPLTELANRRGFDQFLREKWRHARREKEPVAMLMVEIDSFRPFCDNYGHEEADECLKQVAATVKQWTRRAADLAARYGAEEFVAVLPDTGLEAAAKIAEGIRFTVQNLQYRHGFSPPAGVVTVSVGVASMMPQTGTEPAHLVKLARQALGEAKQKGRNRVAVAPEKPIAA